MSDTSWLTDKTIIVTGAAGFIGSHLVTALLESGSRVYGIDNFLTGNRANVAHLFNHPDFTLLEADCRANPADFLPSDVRFDAVLHFASPASPSLYQKYPIETYQVNAFATHTLLTYLHDHHPSARFFFASTSEVYGDPAVHPQPETYWGNVNPNGVRACYDEGKRLGEAICGVFQRDFGMDVRIIRIFNTYGPRMDGGDGRIIPNFVTQALRHEPLTLYGDGSQTRSYCFVDDLVKGILLFLSHPDGNGKTINLGNPEEYTAQETAQIIWEAIHPGTPLQLSHHPIPTDDPTRRQPDITKARELLGWQPTVTFKDGLAAVIDYFRNQ